MYLGPTVGDYARMYVQTTLSKLGLVAPPDVPGGKIVCVESKDVEDRAFYAVHVVVHRLVAEATKASCSDAPYWPNVTLAEFENRIVSKATHIPFSSPEYRSAEVLVDWAKDKPVTARGEAALYALHIIRKWAIGKQSIHNPDAPVVQWDNQNMEEAAHKTWSALTARLVPILSKLELQTNVDDVQYVVPKIAAVSGVCVHV